MKGIIQIDYVVAITLFIVLFAFTISFIINYLSSTTDIVKIANLRSDAISLLKIADQDFVPKNWTSNFINYPSRLGLAEKMYRIEILVNNTKQNLNDPTQDAVDLSSELITFNYTEYGLHGNFNSTIIYDENNNTIPYQRNGDLISFVTSINANESKLFILYFDPSGNFTDFSQSVTGSDNVNETVLQIKQLNIISFRNIQSLNNSNYTKMKESIGLENDFYVKIYDTESNTTFSTFGGVVPDEGTVVALQRYVLYQNRTAGIRRARLIVNVW